MAKIETLADATKEIERLTAERDALQAQHDTLRGVVREAQEALLARGIDIDILRGWGDMGGDWRTLSDARLDPYITRGLLAQAVAALASYPVEAR